MTMATLEELRADSCRSISLEEILQLDKSFFHDDEEAILEEEDEMDKDEEKMDIAVNETRSVLILRFIVIVVMLGAAIGVSVAVFLYTRGNEKAYFESVFSDNGQKIVDK